MTLQEFKLSLANTSPPEQLSKLLKAMWHDAKGDWEAAHQLAQSVNSADGDWVHAYLHRKEGDLSNASYWYNRAHKAVSTASLEHEWDEVTSALLERVKK